MKVTRRDCLKAGGLADALTATGCADLTRPVSQPPIPRGWTEEPSGPSHPAPRPQAAPAQHPAQEERGEERAADDFSIWRTLNRAGFGPRPGDLRRVREMGLDAYLEEQLAPERIPEARAVGWRLWMLDSLEADTDFRYELPREQVPPELQQAAVLRAVYSARQLQEVMVDFWTDHFNISQLKGDGAFLKTADDAEVIRKHALGKFRDLLFASATSPAMLSYLDNGRNTRDAGNENYARELMELHTLGVEGGYTQRDVQEVARCFTGWSFEDEGSWRRGAFLFQPEAHDDGPRHVLGVTLPAGLGRRHGERVLEILADHPATARFIAFKLCRRFVADAEAVPGALMERLARTFRRSGGDVRQTLSVLLRSDEFRCGPTRKLKRPFDFVVSAVRALNGETSGKGVLEHLQRMGQLPFQWAMPNGYPDHAAAWLPGLLARWNFAAALVSGQIEGTTVDLEALLRAAKAQAPEAQARALQIALLGRPQPALTARPADDLLRSRGSQALAQAAALLLAAPEFQWR
jgi:uncharacterized protein (DUF1800 family)